MLIEIFSDIICPWCYIGKHRLMRALAQRPHINATIRWLPFQLNPDMPPGGIERADYANIKFGSASRAAQVEAMLSQTAARDGLPLDMARISRTPNTVDAHRLIRYAARGNGAMTMVDALFNAYFVEGRDIGDQATLIEIAAALGFDAMTIGDYLRSSTDLGAIQGSDAAARRLGIHAVPCFIVDEQYALAGAHDAEAFAPIFDLANLNSLTSQRGPALSVAEPVAGG